MSSRTERDSFGPIDVPDAQLWGAQTQRSLEHFHISTERMPPELIHALARVKRGAAKVNLDLGLLDGPKALAITRAADEVLADQHTGEFPLAVWQTGSGTQSNMNMNEVLANRGSELMGGVRGEQRLLHPNDDVNLGQSSNDIFPTAIHVAAAQALANTVLPALRQLRATLHAKASDVACSVARSWRSAGSTVLASACAAATWIAVGKMSFDDWPRLTSSLGCSKRFSPRTPPISSEPRLASTSFIFIFDCVPEPVCHTARGNSPLCWLASTSSAARVMASAFEPSSRPRSRLTLAAPRLTRASAWISSGGMRSVEMWKCSSERWVCAPHSCASGTSMGPKLSRSVLLLMAVPWF